MDTCTLLTIIIVAMIIGDAIVKVAVIRSAPKEDK